MKQKRSETILALFIMLGLFAAGGASGALLIQGDNAEINAPTQPEYDKVTTDPVDTTTEDPPNLNNETDTSVQSNESIQAAVNGTATIYIEGEKELSSQGSGFIYEEDYLITNNHVISPRQQEISESDTIFIMYADNSWTTAEVVGTDEYTDIAVLDPQRVPDFSKTMTLSEEVPEQSEKVYAIGSPFGYSKSVSSGIVSATGRSMETQQNFTIPDTIQVDADLDSGNSGGPLVSADNPTKIVGVNRKKQGDAVGLAISSRLTKRVADSIIENGEFNHTYVGVSAKALTPIVDGYEDVSIKKGIVVSDTLEGSPVDGKLQSSSSSEGLEDIIVSLEGQPVSDLEDLSKYLMLHKNVGDEITMTVYNDGETRTVTIELDDRSNYTDQSS